MRNFRERILTFHAMKQEKETHLSSQIKCEELRFPLLIWFSAQSWLDVANLTRLNIHNTENS